MTNRGGGEAVLPRPVAVVPVAKPRGKLNTLAPSSASSAGPETTTNHYVNQGAVPKSPRNSSPGDTDTMTKTKAILNEAADAVAKSFAKQTQGINKGRKISCKMQITNRGCWRKEVPFMFAFHKTE